MKHKMVPAESSHYTHECINNDCGYVEFAHQGVGVNIYVSDMDCEGTAPLEYNERGLSTFFNQLVQFKERAEELRELYVKAYPEDKEAKNADEIDFEDSYLSPSGYVRFKGEYQHCSGCSPDHYSFNLPMRYFVQDAEEALRQTAEEKRAAAEKKAEKERIEREKALERKKREDEERDRREFERLKAKFENQEEQGYPAFTDGGVPLG
jgi:hypothetical protein